jgi:thiol-disulfide isomerase/thioredoxin
MAKRSVAILDAQTRVLSKNQVLFLRRNQPGWSLGLFAMFTVLLVACGGAANNGLGIEGGNGAGSREVAADFAIKIYTGASSVGGEEIDFSDLRGKPVVLNFWAGLCPPCRAEMPDLQEFYEEFGDRVTLIGVDVGQFTGLGDQDDARELLESLAITYPTGFTNDNSVMQDYAVLSMPTTVFITSEGAIFRKWSGALNRQTLTDITNEMLGQEPG